MSTFVLDNLPRELLRFYDEEQWARDLAFYGRLRMWRIKHYATRIDSRGDPTEGSSARKIPGSVPRVAIDVNTGAVSDAWEEPGHFNFSGSLVNPIYTFSTSFPGVDTAFAQPHFGNYRVRIVNPAEFAAELYRALDRFEFPESRPLHFLDGFPVQYDKGEVGEEPTGETRLRIHFGQKPPQYQAESEYRFAAVFGGATEGSPEYIDLQLNRFDTLFAFEGP